MAVQQPKVLRIGVIQDGKLVEERVMGARQAVTVGTDPGNTLVLPQAGFGESFTVLAWQGDRCLLRFAEGMGGWIKGPGGRGELSALAASGQARKEGRGWVLPLADDLRGQVSLGDTALVWQFVVAAADLPKPVLPPEATHNHFKSLDSLFSPILIASFLVHAVVFVGLANTDLPPEVTIEQIPDRYARLLIPDKVPAPPVEKKEEAPPPVEEKKVEEKKPEAAAKKAEKPVETAEQAAARKAARAAAVAKAVQSKGMLKVLGSLGPGAGGTAVADVFGAGGGMTDVAAALSGAGGVAVATDPGAGGARKGGGQGGAASIGDLATSGGGKVAYAAKTEVKVSGSVAAEAAEIDSSDIDQAKLGAFVRARMGLIKACYENALKRNPSLKGRLVIRFTILETGGLTDVTVAVNSLGSPEVASCITSTMRTWRTQFRPSGPASVEYPFVFTASN